MCMRRFCNVWVCVGVYFVMCGRKCVFCNVCLCVCVGGVCNVCVCVFVMFGYVYVWVL